MNATDTISADELKPSRAKNLVRFLAGQGLLLTENGETVPVRVLDSNRSGSRRLIAQRDTDGDRAITRWVDAKLISPSLTILVGNKVRLEDGRTGTVDEIVGSTATVEVPRPKSSPVSILRSYDDIFELVEVPLASLSFAN